MNRIRLDWAGGGERLWTSLEEKNEFPVFPEMENSHWLKGDKGVITLTMADHDCVQSHFAACSSCHRTG